MMTRKQTPSDGAKKIFETNGLHTKKKTPFLAPVMDFHSEKNFAEDHPMNIPTRCLILIVQVIIEMYKFYKNCVFFFDVGHVHVQEITFNIIP